MGRTARLVVATVLALAAAAWLLAAAPPQAADGDRGRPGEPAEHRGALLDQLVFTEESSPGKAVGQIESGTRQLLAQGVTDGNIYRQIRRSPAIESSLSYGASAELTLNPAGPEVGEGRLNPFHSRAVREAMNWLVDREHIAAELYGGLAAPRVLPLTTAFPDYARLAARARALEQHYRYRPDHAETVIAEAMRGLGATRRDGRWHYGGEPVELRLLIRTEDARRRVGDYVARQLESVGFAVERLYRTAEQAAPLWYGGDPAAGRWHLYTGGWVSTLINRDQAQNFADFYTPRGRPSPLWQAYAPGEELDRLAARLARRDYADAAERRELMGRALTLAMRDSVRVWLVDQLSVWPRGAGVRLAADLAGGVAGSWLWPYTLRFDGRIGGEMTIATPSVLTEPWNPVAGTNWLYDQMIMRGLGDAPLLPDPYTGLYRPQRIAAARVTVTEGAPVQRSLDWLSLDTRDRIQVPTEAWVDWDATQGRFVTRGDAHPEGLSARSRVRVEYAEGYLERRWHDGSRVSLADLVLPMILQFARGAEGTGLFDRAHAPELETFREHFRGWRIVSRSPLVVEIYSDQIYPDAETMVATRTPSALPWHTLAPGIRAERAGELSFSSDKADRRRNTWLSLVSGPSLPVLDRHREAAAADAWVPFADALGPWLRAGEPEARYRRLADWRRERGHYWIGDGAFYLHSVHPVEGAVVLRRFEGFPDRADKWLALSEARIPGPVLDGPLTVTAGEPARFSLDIRFEGEPYPPQAIDAVEYLLFAADGELLRRGPVTHGSEGWRIRLDADAVSALGSGASRLEVAVRAEDVALPRFASHVFATLPAEAGGS